MLFIIKLKGISISILLRSTEGTIVGRGGEYASILGEWRLGISVLIKEKLDNWGKTWKN